MRSPPAELRLHYLQRPSPVSEWQTYFPSLEVLFPSVAEQTDGSPCLAASELVVALADDRLTAVVEHLLTKEVRTIPIWIRHMHLLPPLEVMEGTYIMPRDGALPTFRMAWQQTLAKLNDPYNEAYTDAVFACMASRLVETGKSPHFCRFFGTFNGRAPTYTYTITDDLPDIEGEKWFRDGLRDGKFRVMVVDPYDANVHAEYTLAWNNADEGAGHVREAADAETASVCSDASASGASGASSVSSASTESASISSLEEADGADIAMDGEVQLVRPRLRLQRISHEHDAPDDSTDTMTTESDDGLEFKMVVSDFPVQSTVIERCDGTMDALMEEEVASSATADMRETKEARWTAWLFQVIAGLTTAQQYYDFVHNDLHTNNVMWCGTGQTHMYYHVTGATGGDRYYRVPTYGRLFKIIDFGRATFRPPTATAAKKNGTGPIWFPDAYAPAADAMGQYNCGPYYDRTKPKVAPNKSFDLCRLAAAMLDMLWPFPDGAPTNATPPHVLTREPGRIQHETTSALWNLMWLWLTDRDGRNLLRDADDNERYPNFDLYCAIARGAVNAVPAQQLTLPLFDAAYRCRRRDIPADATIYRLQAESPQRVRAV